MRSIHDAVRASRPHLTELLRRDLARLFDDEELLASLSSRLLVFARQGVPEPPPPHFAAECTPPLAEVYEPFRHPVAAWHDAPDSPEVPALFAQAMTTSGIRN